MGPESPLTNRLEISATHDYAELEQRLRNVSTKGVKGNLHCPYRESTIALTSVNPNDLNPCALYALSDHLELINRLRAEFQILGIDILNLNSDSALLEYSRQGRSNAIISPPIVEKSVDDDGKLVVVDGLHRVLMARNQGLNNISVVMIENSASPIPAYPVSWDEVEVMNHIPPIEAKRKFRLTAENLPLWTSGNYARYMQGFDFPERKLLPSINRDDLIATENTDLSNPEGSDSAFIFTPSGILLVHRREDNKWALPSGKIDITDTHSDSSWSKHKAPTVRRELYEETGLIALRWKKIHTHETGKGKHVTFWQVEVADEDYVPIDIEAYAEHFNRSGGNEEISEIGLHQPGNLKQLEIFKTGYNLPAIFMNLLYSGLALNELRDDDLESLGLEVSNWEAQLGVEPMPNSHRFQRDFSQVRTV